MNKEELSIKDKIYEETKEFGRAQFVDEIYKLHQENKVLKDAIKEVIDYIKTTQYSDVAGLNKYSILEFWFVKEILEILERTDK